MRRPHGIDRGRQHLQRSAERARIDAFLAAERVRETVRSVDQKHVVGAEQRLETQPDILMRPLRVEILPEMLDRRVRGGDVLRLEHGPKPALGKRIEQELALLMQRDLVGPPGGGDHGDGDERHRQGDQQRDRQHRPRVERATIHAAEPLPFALPHRISPR